MHRHTDLLIWLIPVRLLHPKESALWNGTQRKVCVRGAEGGTRQERGEQIQTNQITERLRVPEKKEGRDPKRSNGRDMILASGVTNPESVIKVLSTIYIPMTPKFIFPSKPFLLTSNSQLAMSFWLSNLTSHT